MTRRWNLETTLVHAGERAPELPGSPTVHPLSLSNTYTAPLRQMDAVLGGAPGYTYGRHGNPTVDAFADAVAALEGGSTALAYGSGMAAIHAVLTALELRSGDRIVLSQDLYGASLNLVDQIFQPMGVEAVTADLTDLSAAARLLGEARPKAVLFELISNPLLRVVDGPALTTLAHQAGARVIVDNTFTTPLIARPLDFGADFVVHSATKYLGGHGDAIGGVVVADHAFHETLHRQQKLLGTILGPFEAWLLHRGLKTLGLRFPRQCENARELALRLSASGRFEAVHHPLLPDHPEHARALALFPEGLAGAVVTLEIGGGKPEAFRFLEALELVIPATTVGDVYTLALYPVISSHRSQTPEARARMGIHEGTVRIAVGIESVDDLSGDLLQAADRIR